jgi:SAM-dependent methyltransferase
VRALLDASEARATIPRFARRALRRLELLMSGEMALTAQATVARLFVAPIEARQPRRALTLPRKIERIRLRILNNGDPAGEMHFLVHPTIGLREIDSLLAAEFDVPFPQPSASQKAWSSGWSGVLKSGRLLSRLWATKSQDTPSPVLAATVEDSTSYDVRSQNYWEQIFRSPDPWGYTNEYESTKYKQTLDALPKGRFSRALELACAEGHFTRDLAGRVEHLIATDISPTALLRARERCGDRENVEFMRLNLLEDAIPGQFDLIVCSEVLYYVEDRAKLGEIAHRVARHLKDDGWLVMTHANLVVDEPAATGFRWPHLFGAKGIGDIFAQTPNLALASERVSPLYRIQVFRKVNDRDDAIVPEHIDIPHADVLPAEVLAQVTWKGDRSPVIKVGPRHMPILTYHRIADDGPAALARYRLPLREFDDQLRWLCDNGFTGVSLSMLRSAIWENGTLPERPVMITFDDGYKDILTAALPILRGHGFPATVFVVTDAVGGHADWDGAWGPPAPLLS